MKIFLQVIMLLAISGTSSGQISLSGKVTDSLSLPVGSTTIRITEKNISAVSNSKAVYFVSGLAGGTYNFSVSSPGYEPQRLRFTVDSRQNVLNNVLSGRRN